MCEFRGTKACCQCTVCDVDGAIVLRNAGTDLGLVDDETWAAALGCEVEDMFLSPADGPWCSGGSASPR